VETKTNRIPEATVKTNTGEVAEFSDGSNIIRQRPGVGTAADVNYKKIIQPDAFKGVFKVGRTKSQVNDRLINPPSTDGVPISSHLETNTIKTNQIRPDISQLGQVNDKLKE
jgi:hypothetical protein